MSRPDLVTTDPDMCAGRPCFARHWLPIATVLGRLDAGDSMAALQRDYPRLRADHLAAARKEQKARLRSRGPGRPFGPASRQIDGFHADDGPRKVEGLERK